MESKKIIEFLEGRRNNYIDEMKKDYPSVVSSNGMILSASVYEIDSLINFIKAEEIKEKEESEVNRPETEKGDSKTWFDKETEKALEKIKDDFKAFEENF